MCQPFTRLDRQHMDPITGMICHEQLVVAAHGEAEVTLCLINQDWEGV